MVFHGKEVHSQFCHLRKPDYRARTKTGDHPVLPMVCQEEPKRFAKAFSSVIGRKDFPELLRFDFSRFRQGLNLCSGFCRPEPSHSTTEPEANLAIFPLCTLASC
jgi:hypothetical protein